VPGEGFYEGLLLPQAVRKLADHHAAPRNRHISFHEYQLLMRAAAELDRPRRGRKPSTRDFEEQWAAFLQAYWTGFSSPSSQTAIEVYSIPERVAREVPMVAALVDATFSPKDVVRVPATRVVPASVISAQAAVATLLLVENGATKQSAYELFEQLSAQPTLVERELGDDDLELLNRVLYQRSIPAEGSEPSFKSLQDLLSTATGGAVGITELPEVGYAGIFKVGATIIITRVALAIGDRLAELIRDFKRQPPAPS
jgi:hypothetical protein